MFRRMLLALAFVGALGAAGFGVTNTAEARHGCRYGGYGDYYGAYYGGYYPHVYRSSYYPPAYYGAPVYRSYYGGYGGYGGRCHDRGGVYFSVGF